ncbi:hypothetical protein HDV00_002509 [Rhizophlyctis rosea]|nr:hypothetical protein HDV00_002509 [Rhizophlyctis rosea]
MLSASNNPHDESSLAHLLEANKEWAAQQLQADPECFDKAAAGQAPPILYIGCSDSRVPPNILVGLGPGEMFVHRNIANVFSSSDLNLLSVMQYAVEYLKVQHIVVCGKHLIPLQPPPPSPNRDMKTYLTFKGHYGCGGVNAALSGKEFGLIDNWLRHIQDTYWICQDRVDAVEDAKHKGDLMSELNVLRSALNVVNTTIVKNAWKRGQKVAVHAWCYRLDDGIIRNLTKPVDSEEEIKAYIEETLKTKAEPQYVTEAK